MEKGINYKRMDKSNSWADQLQSCPWNKKRILFDYVLLKVVLVKGFFFIWRRHHWRQRTVKFSALAFMAFEQGGIFIVSYLLWQGTWQGIMRSYSNPDPHGTKESTKTIRLNQVGILVIIVFPKKGRGWKLTLDLFVSALFGIVHYNVLTSAIGGRRVPAIVWGFVEEG